MTNETLLDIEQAELIYSMEETTATIYGSQRDINRVSDAAYKAADAYERAYQESGAYEDKKQSLHWRAAARAWHYTAMSAATFTLSALLGYIATEAIVKRIRGRN